VKKFSLPLTTAISAAMLASAGCSSDEQWQASENTKVCVDVSGNRVPEDQCRNRPLGGISPFRWYYISRGGYVPSYYGTPTGGSYVPAASAESYAPAPAAAPAGAVTRGGFGDFGAVDGGGHAGGGGAGE
jgi:hypothetical protein